MSVSFQSNLSSNATSFARQASSLERFEQTRGVQEPVIPSFRKSLIGFLMQALYFQGAMSLISPMKITTSFDSLPSGVTADSSNQTSSTMPIASFALPVDLAGGHSASSAQYQVTPNCLTPDCPDLDKSQLHPREIEAVDYVFDSSIVSTFKTRQEWLRFRKDDAKEKMFFGVADPATDLRRDGTVNPEGALHPKWITQIFNSLDMKFDLKYKITPYYENICQEIENGKETGKLTNALITGHGNSDSIHLSGREYITRPGNWNYLFSTSLSKCFSGLEPHGKIILLSCSTGKPNGDDPFDNIAQDLANEARRTVIAPTDLAYPGLVKVQASSSEPVMLFQEHEWGLPFWKFKLPVNTHFRIFTPRYPKCTNLDENALDSREHEVIEVAKTELIARNMLWTPPTFTEMQDYLRFCKDDPKPKFLYLQAKYNPVGALHPSHISSLLVDLADKFDLKFSVIQSETEICKEVNHAIKYGELAAVLIHSHGSTTSLNITKEETISGVFFQAWFGEGLFPFCLKKIPASARIILAGGSTGAPIEEAWYLQLNLAKRVRNYAERTVIASDRPVYGKKIVLKSYDPVEIYHPVNGIFGDYSENVFKQFDPQK